MNNKNRTKSNSQLFQEYSNIIANSYSRACYEEASRLLGLYIKHLGGEVPSIHNFSSFFIRYRDLKPNTRARYYSVFRGFFKWYSGEDLPFKVKAARVEPQLVQDDEIEKLREAMHKKKKHRGLLERDLLMLDTMLMTGIRRGELANLKVNDIYFDDGKSFIVVRNGKGAKDRIIPLNPTIAIRLRKYINDHKLSGEVFRRGNTPSSFGVVRRRVAGPGLDFKTVALAFQSLGICGTSMFRD